MKILKHIIQIASNEGDVVLDPFMGVGSTGAAALEMGRKFVGFELDETYFNATKERLNEFPGTQGLLKKLLNKEVIL